MIQEGFAGYGLYWAILEILRDAPAYRYLSDEKVWSYVLHAQDPAQVGRVLRDYGLFEIDKDGMLFSPWLNSQLGEYDEQKRKRSEAGRRGAASRWGDKAKEDGKAMAMPSKEDGKAMAYNATQYNLTQPNITSLPSFDSEDVRKILSDTGEKIDEQLFQALDAAAPDGTGVGYIAQCCWHFGIGKNVYDFLVKLTDGGNLTNDYYLKFCALVRRVQAEKYPIKLPNNFFVKKLLE